MLNERIRIRIDKDNNLVKTTNKKAIELEWDGVYWVHYGHIRKHFKQDGKEYNCFPIMYINEDLTRVEDIEMFGCEGDNTCEDGVLFHVVPDFNVWKSLKPFEELRKLANNGTMYQLVGMLLHPEGNYEDDSDAIADYYLITEKDNTALELLKNKYKVVSDHFHHFNSVQTYIIDDDNDGYYLYKKVNS